MSKKKNVTNQLITDAKQPGVARTSAQIAQLWWKKACEFDGADPKASHVVFSVDNPYASKYRQALSDFLTSVDVPLIPEGEPHG